MCTSENYVAPNSRTQDPTTVAARPEIKRSPWRVVPDLSASDYEALLTSVRDPGVLVPIVIDEDGFIIDGHHRWRAAQDAGRRDVPFIILPGLTEQQKREEARRLNLARRHLTTAQKYDIIDEQLRETPEKSARTIGRTLGVAHKTVEKRKKKLEAEGEIPVLDYVEDEQGRRQPRHKRRKTIHIRNVAQARRALTDADEFAGGDLPHHARDGRSLAKAAAKHKKERLEAEELAEYLAEPYSGELEVDTVRVADVRELDLPGESVDLFFTDPKYDGDQLDVYEAIARLASRVLKPGCFLFAYCGKQYLPQVIERLGRHLEYVWAMADVYETGDHVVQALRIKEKHRTILVYKTPGETPKRVLVPDAVHSPKQKDDHDLQNADVAARTYIEAYTRPGDVVLDPCVGGGTVPAVCVELDRHFLAFDVDPKAVRRTLRRLAKLARADRTEGEPDDDAVAAHAAMPVLIGGASL